MSLATRRSIGKDQWPLAAAFVIYLVLLAFCISRHELWGDELHSWNIAKASHSFTELIHNSRFEGHPPLWYTLMWALSKFSHNLIYLQWLQGIIAGCAVSLLIFHSPFPVKARLLLPFGYYFLFEYGVFSRNYAPALLICFCMLIVLKRAKSYRNAVYYPLLFLLANTHLLAAVLAAAIHIYYLLHQKEDGLRKPVLALHLLAGIVSILPALYFIFPPSDSEMNLHFWMSRWSIRQLKDIAAAPAKSFVPLPAWWEYHFWNTHFLINASYRWALLKPVIYLSSIVLTGLTFFILKENRKSSALFFFNLLFTVAVATVFPLTSSRYVGFIFIGFIVAAWLYQEEKPLTHKREMGLYILLVLQIAGSLVAVPRDIQYVFSNSSKVKELILEVPTGNRIVTDYYCLNNVLAYTDGPAYSIETNKLRSFILWEQKPKTAEESQTVYTDGASRLFKESGLHSFYLLSSLPPETLAQMDGQLGITYKVSLVDKREGAIEKYSNIYLYRISLIVAKM